MHNRLKKTAWRPFCYHTNTFYDEKFSHYKSTQHNASGKKMLKLNYSEKVDAKKNTEVMDNLLWALYINGLQEIMFKLY